MSATISLPRYWLAAPRGNGPRALHAAGGQCKGKIAETFDGIMAVRQSAGSNIRVCRRCLGSTIARTPPRPLVHTEGSCGEPDCTSDQKPLTQEDVAETWRDHLLDATRWVRLGLVVLFAGLLLVGIDAVIPDALKVAGAIVVILNIWRVLR